VDVKSLKNVERKEEKVEKSVGASVATTEEIEESEVAEVDSFDDMGLRNNLLRGVYGHGFEKPSLIQQKAIIPLCSGRDVIAQAQSGSGKTGTFAIGVLQRINTGQNCAQALVMLPTRELAVQVSQVMSALGDHDGAKVQLCIGGTPIRGRSGSNSSGGHVLVGTPGRIHDMLERKLIRPETIKVVILDEADEMLSIGFKEAIYEIFQFLPKEAQIGLFSATMPPEALEITKHFMNNPIRIIVKKEEVTLQGILQYYVALENSKHKFDTLVDLFGSLSVSQSVIFANSKRTVEWLANELDKCDFTVSATHGDLDHSERMKRLDDFKSSRSRILVTTDLYARGIDAQAVSVVINYDLPSLKETYIHRIGRSGRFGRKGLAITLVNYDEADKLRQLERYYNTYIGELPKNITELI